MSFRNEKKYRLSYGDSFKIKSELIKLGMKKLYPNRQINSEYLDTKELKMFSDSEEGVLPRKKIRIRWYHDKTNQNLETKISSIEGHINITSFKNISNENSANPIIPKNEFLILSLNGLLIN